MFLIEQLENIFQLVSLVILTGLTIYKSVTTHKRIWGLLSMFYATASLGNIYWFLYMMFYQQTPYYSFIPDFCWIAAVLFMAVLLLQIKDGEWNWRENRLLWPVPVLTAGMAIFFMQWGEYLTNTAYAVAMTVLLYCGANGLFFSEKGSKKIWLFVASLSFCLIEYGLWTVSCFSENSVFLNLYYLFDLLLTLAYISFYPATGKAAGDELH